MLLLDKPNENCKNCIRFEEKCLIHHIKDFKKKIKKYCTSKDKCPNFTNFCRTSKSNNSDLSNGNKQLKMQLRQLEEEISKASLPVSADLSKDFKWKLTKYKFPSSWGYFGRSSKNIYNLLQTILNITPWLYVIVCRLHQNLKLRMMIYIYIFCNDWTGFVILPSRCWLRVYKNCIGPQRGFNKDIVNELREKVKYISDNERYFVMLMDEMKIQENLVCDRHTGDLIDYVDFGDTELNFATL